MKMLKFKEFTELYESLLVESISTKWQDKVKDAYLQFAGNNYIVKPKTKYGVQELIRADFTLGNSFDVEDNVIKFLTNQGLSQDQYQLEETKEHSGSFISFYITFLKPVNWFGKEIEEGKKYSIVNAIKIKGDVIRVIADKQTSPDKMELVGKWLTAESIRSAAKESIKSKIPDINYQNFMIKLVDSVYEYKGKYKTVEDTLKSNIDISIKSDFSEYATSIDPGSVLAIQKDFGEVLGGIFMFSLVKEHGEGLLFPQESNLELVDFFFNKLAVSSKAGKKGAKSSASGYINAIETASEAGNWKLSPSEEEVKNLLSIISQNRIEPKNTEYLTKSKSSTTFTGSIDLFENYLIGSGDNGWVYFRRFCQDPINSINRDSIVKVFLDQKNSNKLHEFISGFKKASPFSSKDKKLNRLLNSRRENEAQIALDEIINDQDYDLLIGMILYPCSKQLQDIINRKYLDSLSLLINRSLNINQLYLDIKLKKDSIDFKIKSMKNNQFEFGTLNSIGKWHNSKITISMK